MKFHLGVLILVLVALVSLAAQCGAPATQAPVVEEPTKAPVVEEPTKAPVVEEATEAPVVEEATEVPVVEEATQAPAPAAADGVALLEGRCTQCHDLERTTSASKTEDGWKANVERMVAKGAKLDPAEQEVLVKYLAENYGK